MGVGEVVCVRVWAFDERESRSRPREWCREREWWRSRGEAMGWVCVGVCVGGCCLSVVGYEAQYSELLLT